ncbi:hypothetical protein [Nonomuraea fuscirosea]|uniref:hypothetical protein n=1 Tax=Nonomuraea fuscirosea TaxID=1291556 RepID=UPI0033C91FA2
MENWIEQPIVDPEIPEGDRRRMAVALPALLARPDPEPPRWVRRLFAAGAVLSATAAVALAGVAGGTGRGSAMLAAMMLLFVAIVCTGVARSHEGTRLSRRYAGRYVIPATLDDPALDLLARARRAVGDVSGSRAHRLGLLDAVANDVVLPRHLWEIAGLVRVHADLRAEQAEALGEAMTPGLAAVLRPQQEALRRSVAAVTERVRELEAYADQVRAADSALRAGDLRRSDDRYLDLLARADDTSDLRALTAEAAALTAGLHTDNASGPGAAGLHTDNASGPGAAGLRAGNAPGPRPDDGPGGSATC